MKPNWPTKKVGDVLEKIPQIRGIKTNLYHKEGQYPIIDQGQSFIAGYSDNATAVYKGRLPVVVFGDHTRAIKFLEYPFILGADGTKILLPNKEFDGKFFYFSLLNLNIKTRGYARHYKLLREKEIPLPPLEIQKKIVKKIEELFAKIAQAQSFRETVMQDTDNLIPSALIKTFTEIESKERNINKLVNICQIIMGQSPPSVTYNVSRKGLPFYQGKKDYGEVYPTPRVWCSDPVKIAERNDILISVRAPVGALNISVEKSCIGRGLAGVRAGEKINFKYLYYFLRKMEKEIASWGTGSTFAAISKKHLENIIIPLPPLPEQKKIVARMDALTQKVRQLQKLQSETATNLTALKQSILHKAFLGKL